jgi:hypothetical protein
MNIHDKARQLVRELHGEWTLSEAYAELARRAAVARRYGKCRAAARKPADFAAVESPRKFWWTEN